MAMAGRRKGWALHKHAKMETDREMATGNGWMDKLIEGTSSDSAVSSGDQRQQR